MEGREFRWGVGVELEKKSRGKEVECGFCDSIERELVVVFMLVW